MQKENLKKRKNYDFPLSSYVLKDVNPCTNNPCIEENKTACTVDDDGYVCNCNFGYELKDNKCVSISCINNIDCEDDNVCTNNICNNGNCHFLEKCDEIDNLFCIKENGNCECKSGYFNIDKTNDNCEYSCEISNNGIEQCDGIDNDCNKITDDSDKFTESDCYLNADESVIPKCEDGICNYSCKENYWNMNTATHICEYYCVFSQEICDGADNNCDTIIDDGLSCDCSEQTIQNCVIINTQCSGSQTCNSEGWGDCIAENTVNVIGNEICDNFDNNCDGFTDENFKTGNIYTNIDNCGECGNKCENTYGTTQCTSNGVCNPLCLKGFANSDNNVNNGCDIGCLTNFNENGYKNILQSNEINKIIKSDSINNENNLVVAYIFQEGLIQNIYISVIDLQGIIQSTKKITNKVERNTIGSVSITNNGNGIYFILYSELQQGNYKIIKITYNSSTQEFSENNVATGTNINYKPYLSKKTYNNSEIPFSFYDGNAVLYYGTINKTTGVTSGCKTLKISSTLTNEYLNPVISATADKIGILFCEKDKSNTKSYLNIATFDYNYNPNTTNISKILLETYIGSTNCKITQNISDPNLYDLHYDITSDGNNFYISFITEEGLIVRKYSPSNILLTEYELLNSTSPLSETSTAINTSAINIENNILTVAYILKIFNLTLNTTSYKLKYQRFNPMLNQLTEDLIVKIPLINNISIVDRINLFYTNSRNLILLFLTKSTESTNIDKIMNYSSTNSCIE